ncbi:MAG: molybdopterin-binding protein [Pseudomonadota bacterium]
MEKVEKMRGEADRGDVSSENTSNGESGEVTAAALAIGDELLSGRTRDLNVHRLGAWLGERAVRLKEARIVGDDIPVIAAALNALRATHDYVFTSGGIGPTHDDLTVDAVSFAFDVPVVENSEAIARMSKWYAARGEALTPARRRMARMPEGAVLIDNPVTGAPGIRIGNVYVMAGVPSIFEGMLHAVATEIKQGVKVYSHAVTAYGLQESKIADELRRIQNDAANVSVGSYPIDGDEKGVTIVARSANEQFALSAIEEVTAIMTSIGATPIPGDRKSS